MRIVSQVVLLIACACQIGYAGELNWYEWQGSADVNFGGLIDEMHAVKIINSKDDRRIIFGDRQGQVHAVRLKKGKFQEEWAGQPLRSAIAEVFVKDIDGDGKLEIVAYSEFGDIALYRADTYKLIWASTDDEYSTISSMIVQNIDNDPQYELVFCAEPRTDVTNYRSSGGGSQEEVERQREREISRLFVFDCRNLFVEWESQPGVYGQSILVGDLDDDGIQEIVLNTGFVLDAEYRRIEWQYPDGFGQKIGFADVDGDGIPEIVGEYHSPTRPRRFLRFFDVDQQTESFLGTRRR
jgi:hypothetical protein